MPISDPEARRRYMANWAAQNRDRLRERRGRQQLREFSRDYHLLCLANGTTIPTPSTGPAPSSSEIAHQDY